MLKEVSTVFWSENIRISKDFSAASVDSAEQAVPNKIFAVHILVIGHAITAVI